MSSLLNELLYEHMDVNPTIILITLLLSENKWPIWEEFPQSIMPYSNKDWKFAKYTTLRTCNIQDRR